MSGTTKLVLAVWLLSLTGCNLLPAKVSLRCESRLTILVDERPVGLIQTRFERNFHSPVSCRVEVARAIQIKGPTALHVCGREP